MKAFILALSLVATNAAIAADCVSYHPPTSAVTYQHVNANGYKTIIVTKTDSDSPAAGFIGLYDGQGKQIAGSTQGSVLFSKAPNSPPWQIKMTDQTTCATPRYQNGALVWIPGIEIR